MENNVTKKNGKCTLNINAKPPISISNNFRNNFKEHIREVAAQAVNEAEFIQSLENIEVSDSED